MWHCKRSYGFFFILRSEVKESALHACTFDDARLCHFGMVQRQIYAAQIFAHNYLRAREKAFASPLLRRTVSR